MARFNQLGHQERAFPLETLHFGEIHTLRYIILKPAVQITVVALLGMMNWLPFISKWNTLKKSTALLLEWVIFLCTPWSEVLDCTRTTDGWLALVKSDKNKCLAPAIRQMPSRHWSIFGHWRKLIVQFARNYMFINIWGTIQYNCTYPIDIPDCVPLHWA